MKRMTCRQLGGACDLVFEAETWDEMKQKSMNHGKEMFAKGDKDHLAAMQKMKSKMQDPNAMEKWMEEKEEEFNNS